MGMGFVLKIGDFNEMPKIPHDFPRCGNWVPSTEDSTDSTEDTTVTDAASCAKVSAIMMVLCWFVLNVTNYGM
jgi:hypothetical protein